MQRVKYGAFCLYAIVLALGAYGFATTRGLRSAEAHGLVLHASSYHAYGRHHPRFAIDRRVAPSTRAERWAPHPGDRTPTLRLSGFTKTVRGLELVFSGNAEPPLDYAAGRLRCGESGSEHAFPGGVGHRLRMDLNCPADSTVLISFDEPGVDNGAVNIVELVHWPR